MEGKPQEEIDKLISFLNALNLPVTLEQLGIRGEVANNISKITNGVELTAEALDKLSFKVNSELIEKAITKADKFGKDSLKVV